LATVLASGHARGDGCFVFTWNKQKDINEPTQKAILLYDQGREDLVLQVKYEGPAEDFGWLIPVPALPEVRKGSMDYFYELSRLTQERFGDGLVHKRTGSLGGAPEPVKVIEIKTVGAYEVAALSTREVQGAGVQVGWIWSSSVTPGAFVVKTRQFEGGRDLPNEALHLPETPGR
jgi:hypothetical protein